MRQQRGRTFVGLLIMAAAVAGCGGAGAVAPRSLTVFAAASLTDAFQDLGKGFSTTHPGVEIVFNFAGSQALRTQIEEGAEADVFASANHKEMDALADSGALIGEDKPFATNLLTIIVAPGNPGAIESPHDLAKPGVKLVLAAEDVPAGNYARQALARFAEVYGASFPETALQNVVSNEDNVKQVVAKVQLGEADAGIVYETDAAAASELDTVSIPEAQNVIAEYPIAVLAEGDHVSLATEFVEYVLSPEGQGILQTWGFRPPS